MKFNFPRIDGLSYRLNEYSSVRGLITQAKHISKARGNGATDVRSQGYLVGHEIALPKMTVLSFLRIDSSYSYETRCKVKVKECPNKNLRGIQFYISTEEIEKLDVDPC